MLKHIFLSLLLICGLLGCQQEKQTLPIYPPLLSKAPDIELGDAVLFLVPDSNAKVFWDWRSNAKEIIWLDNGYKENKGVSSRRGLMRINVLGIHSTVLRQTKEELGWTIEMITKGGAKFGPTKVALEPGLGNAEQCFGTLYDGCSFTSLQSLTKAGFDVKKICEVKELGGTIKGYLLSFSGKTSTVLQERYGEGSGGSQTSISLLLSSDVHNACVVD